MESSYGNPILNYVIPAVSRQYYGSDLDEYLYNGLAERYTYGFCSAMINISSGLTNFITKPFNIHLKKIGEYVITLCRSYMNELYLYNMEFTQGFNHYVKVLYYSSPTLKTESLLGYHYDMIYIDHGDYLYDHKFKL